MKRGYFGGIDASGHMRAFHAAALFGCTTKRLNRMASREGLRGCKVTRKTTLYSLREVIAFAAGVGMQPKRGYEKKPEIRLSTGRADRLGNAKKAIIKGWETQQTLEPQLVKELIGIWEADRDAASTGKVVAVVPPYDSTADSGSESYAGTAPGEVVRRYDRPP